MDNAENGRNGCLMEQEKLKKQPILSKKTLVRVFVVIVWIILWEGISLWVDQELLVPSPILVFTRIFQLVQTAMFWQITATTVVRITIGFLLGTFAGVLFAVLTTLSPAVHAFFSPILDIIKATPVASFIILALVWIKGWQIPSFITFLMVFPLIWGNVVKGITQTDPKLLEMAKVYHVKRAGIVRKIYVNSVLPYFIPAVMTSMGFAWKAGIAAEVLAVPRFAIGTEIADARLYLEHVDLFAWSIVIIVISVLLEKLVIWMLGGMDAGRGPAVKSGIADSNRTKG